MQDRKKLPIVTSGNNRVVTGTTCFAEHAKAAVPCMRTRCPHWIERDNAQNCVHIAAANGPHTLQQIGEIYGLTRMRICQIEKSIFEKVRQSVD